MSKSAHTEGPWEVVQYGDGDSLVVHADGLTRICFMATPGESPGAMEHIEANAYLIAAAPDLLAALTWALPLAEIALETGRMDRLRYGHGDIGAPEGHPGLWPEEFAARAHARAALAKSRPTQPQQGEGERG